MNKKNKNKNICILTVICKARVIKYGSQTYEISQEHVRDTESKTFLGMQLIQTRRTVEYWFMIEQGGKPIFGTFRAITKNRKDPRKQMSLLVYFDSFIKAHMSTITKLYCLAANEIALARGNPLEVFEYNLSYQEHHKTKGFSWSHSTKQNMQDYTFCLGLFELDQTH